MPTDDEFRRVAEDVRALARSLARDVRGAVERARDDTRERSHGGLGAVERAGREELRRARNALRQTARPRPGHRHHHHHHRAYEPWWLDSRDDSRETELSAAGRWGSWGRRGREVGHAPDAEDEGRHGPALPRHAIPRPVRVASRPPKPKAASLPLRHRHDGSTLIGLLAVVFGLAWLAAGTHLLQVSAEGVLAVALMVLGLTMAVTARTDWGLSRRSWPMMAGAALVVAMLVSSTSPLGGGLRHVQIGSRTVTATNWADLPVRLQGGIGSSVLDLTALPIPPPSGRDLTVDGSVGSLLVELPPGIGAVIDGRIGLGTVTIDGADVASGFRQSYHQRINPLVGAGGSVFHLRLNSGFGAVRVIEGLRLRAGPVPGAPPRSPKEPGAPKVPAP